MNSYLFSDYTNKTCKKICRRMLRRLSVSFAERLGKKLDYIGMGSLFFEDFKEFYSSGMIDNMTSIEYMLDTQGVFDAVKYRRFLLNRPYDSILLLPVSVSEAIKTLDFSRSFLAWFDYDSTITRETIEETAEVIRKASASGMLVMTTGVQVAAKYKDERHSLHMETVREAFADMLTPENNDLFDTLTWENFSEKLRDAAALYFERLVSEKNSREQKKYCLLKSGRIRYRQPSPFVTDHWLLLDPDEVDPDEIRKCVLSGTDAGDHDLDMAVLTEREKAIIGDRLEEDPRVLAAELSIDISSIRKYLRYWQDYSKP